MAGTSGSKKDTGTMEWPLMSDSERLQHESLFYSQGPVNGVLSGERIRDLFLHTGLPLTSLSRLWNLADVSNDNLLSVEEFCLLMHLTQCHIGGMKLPSDLPASLSPTKLPSVQLSVISEQQKTLYRKGFNSQLTKDKQCLTAQCARAILRGAGVKPAVLKQIWSLADLDKDGLLSADEWDVLCHLVKFVKQGNSLEGSVNIYSCVPHKLSPYSLKAQKYRISRFHKDKAKLSAWKERRKQECIREEKRLEVLCQKITLIEKLIEVLKSTSPNTAPIDLIQTRLKSEKEKLGKQEKIVIRLKREHERVREQTVKAIVTEQKLEEDQRNIKLETEELVKRLSTPHRKSTKDPDPFHQIHEERKELRKKGVRFHNQEVPKAYIPFVFNPFDHDRLKGPPSEQPKTETFSDVHSDDLEHSSLERAEEFWEKVTLLSDSPTQSTPASASPGHSTPTSPDKMSGRRWTFSSDLDTITEEDPVFKPVPVSTAEEFWFAPYLSLDGSTDTHLVELHKKLLDLKSEVEKLNRHGGQLVFRNPDDYNTKLLPASGSQGKARQYRDKLLDNAARRHTSPAGNANNEEESPSKKAAREYRIKRRSLNLEQQKALGESVAVSSVKGGSAENVRSPRASPRASPLASPRASPRPTRILSWRAGRLPSLGDSSSPQRTVPQKLDLSEASKSENLEKLSKEAEPQIDTRNTPEDTVKDIKERVSKFPQKDSSELDISLQVSGLEYPQTSSPGDTVISFHGILSEDVSESETSSGISVICDTSTSISQPLSPVDSGSGFDADKTDVLDDLVFIEEVTTKEESQSKLVDIKDIDLGYSTLKENSLSLEKEKARNDSNASVKPSVPEEIQISSAPLQLLEDKLPIEKQSADSDIDSGNNSGSETPPPLPDSAPPRPLSETQGLEDLSFQQLTTETPFQQILTVNHSKPVIPEKPSQKPPVGQSVVETVTQVSYSDTADQLPLTEASTVDSFKENTTIEKASKPNSPENFSSCENILNEDSTKEDIVLNKSCLEKTSQRNEVEDKTASEETELSPLLPASTPPPLPLSPLPALQTTGLDKQESAGVSSKQYPFTQESSQSPRQKSPGISLEQFHTKNFEDQQGNNCKQNCATTIDNSCDTPGHCDSPDGNTNSVGNFEEVHAIVQQSEQVVSSSVTTSTSGSRFSESGPTLSSQPSSWKEFSEKFHQTIAKRSDSEGKSHHTMSSLERTSVQGEENLVPEHKSRDYTLPSDFVTVESTPHPIPPPRRRSQNENHKSKTKKGGEILKSEDKDCVVEEEITVVKKVEKNSEADIDNLINSLDANSNRYARNGDLTDSDISDGDEHVNTSQSFHLNETDTSNILPDISGETTDGGITLVSYESSIDQPLVSEVRSNKMLSPLVLSNMAVEEVEITPSLTEDNMSEPLSPSRNIGEESLERARDFAEKVQPKYVVRKQNSSGTHDLSSEDLQEMLQERQAVINQTTVLRRTTDWSSWAHDEPQLPREVEAESINKDATLYEWENKIAEETTVSPSERKVSFSGETFPTKINLYSENVISESDTTDEVDRKPIADIASTKKHWESLFQEKNSQKTEDVKPKGTVRHWEVKIHKYEKHSVNSENNNNNNNDVMADSETFENESAIEREIRLALEREEMVKREKAAALSETSVEVSRDSEPVVVVERDAPVHSSYEEMTEVDRAAEMLRRRVMADLEPLEPSTDHDYINLEERRLSTASSQDSSADNRNGVFLNESIVEREIREATEREEERRRERERHRTTSRGSLSDRGGSNVNTSADDTTDGMERVRERASPELTYEKAVSKPDHSGESLIARELRETREREEELKRLRQHVYAKPTNSVTTESNVPTASPKPAQNGHNGTVPSTNGQHSSWQKEVSPYVSSHKRNSSVDSVSSSHSSNRGGSAGSLENASVQEKTVKVQPILQETSNEDRKAYEPCSETPIEREIRLAREREDDFRRAKGLPVADRKSEQPHIVETSVTSNYTRPGHVATENSTLKRLTNNRLKQEIRKEMEREQTLRKEGKISTTSDERAGQPMKFVEVKDETDGTPKRNFLIKKREVISPKVETPNNNGSVTQSSPNTPVTPSSNTPKRSLGGSTTFSYKETRQKAESKIEQELREMKEREEELKQQRAEAVSQTAQGESPR